jgi:hypothetical protein
MGINHPPTLLVAQTQAGKLHQGRLRSPENSLAEREASAGEKERGCCQI